MWALLMSPCYGVFAITIAFLFLAAGVPGYAQTLPNDFTVEGRLYDSAGVPINSTSVDVMLEVINESNSNCVLYRGFAD